jgi:hypothetical protein
MKGVMLPVLVLVLAVTVGCAAPQGASAFQPVDLCSDLDAATLSRYQAETADLASTGQGRHMAVIEYENGWPLGLLAFWKKGQVKVMEGTDGRPQYVVSEARGYGPFSMFWVTGDETLYDADGKRQHSMGMGSAVWGHIYMSHTMENPAPDGAWHRSASHHVMHHMFNWTKEHGESAFYLFSTPNPVGSGG